MIRPAHFGYHRIVVDAGGDFAPIGRLLASEARSAMLDLLMDGADHSATELASQARVAPSTASAHLSSLVRGGLITVERQGRQRRFRLAGPAVARALESLGQVATARAAVSSLRESTARNQLTTARLCYDHLAGRLGVAITNSLVQRGALCSEDGVFSLSEAGTELLSAIGIDVDELRAARRAMVLACSDWTEDRPHVAGALGRALCGLLLESGWIRRRRGTRAVALTELGASSLREQLGVEFR
jgi:DNA-binding transcriptional ArsR family regulator